MCSQWQTETDENVLFLNSLVLHTVPRHQCYSELYPFYWHRSLLVRTLPYRYTRGFRLNTLSYILTEKEHIQFINLLSVEKWISVKEKHPTSSNPQEFGVGIGVVARPYDWAQSTEVMIKRYSDQREINKVPFKVFKWILLNQRKVTLDGDRTWFCYSTCSLWHHLRNGVHFWIYLRHDNNKFQFLTISS